MRDKRLIVAVMFVALVCVLAFTGCAADKTERLECISGHLYSVSPQKVELMLQDSCDYGKVRMK